jgi:hypothetical protein
MEIDNGGSPMVSTRIGIGLCLAMTILAGAAWPEGQSETWAGNPIYSYSDDRGNLIATDRPEDIPERYRNRVTITNGGIVSNAPRAHQASQSSVSAMSGALAEDLLVRLVERVPADIIPGLTAYQSVVLVAGFLVTLMFFGAGKLTGSPFLRLLMPWAIGFLSLATIYFMFLSDLSDKVAARTGAKSKGSLLHQFRDKGKDLADQKQQRLKQADQLTGQE